MCLRSAGRLALLVTLLVAQVNASGFHARRTIVVFGGADAAGMEQVRDQVRELACRLADREVDVVFADAGELLRLVPSAVASDASVAYRALGDRTADDTELELVLVGKDGGVKARSRDASALTDFLTRIDAMPMRRAELRRAGGADRGCD